MKEWLYALLAISFFSVGFVYVYSYFETSYGLTDDIQLSPDYNVYKNTSSIVGQAGSDLLNQSTTSGSASETTIQGAWATIRNFPRVVPITFNLLSRVSRDLGLPPWMLPIFVTFIITGVIMWMIYWIAGLVRPKV